MGIRGVWLHQLASPVMNSREEAGLMCNVASGAGVAYVTRTADLAGGEEAEALDGNSELSAGATCPGGYFS